MIDVTAAEQLLDFNARIDDPERARDQLHGAVALHNLLIRNSVAYLADEVGMGKTYVALGVVALFRHFNPNFRVLIIAPRQNIQRKWIKELRNFVRYNVRFPDLRVKGVDGQPARECVACENILGLVHETSLNPDRDFFARLTSFSLPIGGSGVVDREDAERLRRELTRLFPWLQREVFDLRDKRSFKDNTARAICCALPLFDLVIVDEGHNLKHGFGDSVSARNRVLGLAFGHPEGGADERLFPGYGPRAKRILFLSATPVEETYTHLWNQLHVFGRGAAFKTLAADDVEETQKKETAARFLIRRVATVRINGQDLTKNLYRREWRNGGVDSHDEPICVGDPRQRLVVALVQKKVNEVLRQERFSASFQIGMLASFESFLETANLKRADEDAGVFDDSDQTDDVLEKEGADVADLNRLSRSYRETFGEELPHPKMDVLRRRLSRAWRSGEKSLVFVRRVASVKELKRKLDKDYDEWLIGRLREELPESAQNRLTKVLKRYERERVKAIERADALSSGDDGPDAGGSDTFFAWFFRGQGPSRVISGANLQQRFTQRGTTLATFFEDNYVAVALGCEPGVVADALGRTVGLELSEMREQLRHRAARFIGRAKKPARGDRFEAVQAAAIQWLSETAGVHQELARVIWHTRFEGCSKGAGEPLDIAGWLEERTFFTELRKRPALRAKILPASKASSVRDRFCEQELRARLLAAAARLGHAFIDFYILAIQRLGSLRLRRQEAAVDDDNAPSEWSRIDEYLSLLESQMARPVDERGWAAFDELADIAANFDLILDVNVHDVRQQTLDEATRRFGQILGRQQPTGGMAGQVNQTLVSQFRMPGYPLVLISTDLLQEGEDLHTFCSEIHHYGISWTPSSMEQRIGRIDRVRSQTARRLAGLVGEPKPEDWLQVFYPHLQDTVEVLQVRRVLERMNTFLRLMHDGLTVADNSDRKINLAHEYAGQRPLPEQTRSILRTAFPIRREHLRGQRTVLEVLPDSSKAALQAFKRLHGAAVPGLHVRWEPEPEGCRLYGTVLLGRQQPFMLLLRCVGERLMIRCISPVGRVLKPDDENELRDSVAAALAKVGAIPSAYDQTYDLTVEGDVLCTESDDVNLHRVAFLVRRVAQEADRLEYRHLSGADEPLATFKKDLSGELNHGS